MTAAPSTAAQKAKNQEIGMMVKSHKKEYISLAASSSPRVTRKIPTKLAPRSVSHAEKNIQTALSSPSASIRESKAIRQLETLQESS